MGERPHSHISFTSYSSLELFVLFHSLYIFSVMASPHLSKQSKSIIYKVYNYLQELVANSPDATIREVFSQTQTVTGQACSIHPRTVQRICSEARKSIDAGVLPMELSFESPKKNAPRLKPTTEMDDFNKNIVRRTIQEFYDRGEYPTCQKLKEILMEKTGYSGSITSLWKILKKLGFKYRRCNDGRKFLLEINDIVASRISFLRKMHGIRQESDPRPIIYLDETWINQNHSRSYVWQDSTGQGGLKVPVGKGSRLIICHAGSAKHGFIEGAQLVFQSKCSGDYHQEMNSDVFKEWFINLLRGLEEPCVIVMDNASYHSSLMEKIPSTKTKKADIIAWLQQKNISHNIGNTVPELLSIVREHKDKYKMHELDCLASTMGHEVVRLPPYHCQYNPIELIWAQVKNDVAKRNNAFKIKDVRRLLLEALERVTIEDWSKCVNRCDRLQEEDFIKEGIRDEIIQRIVINLQDDSDCSESDFEG